MRRVKIFPGTWEYLKGKGILSGSDLNRDAGLVRFKDPLFQYSQFPMDLQPQPH